MSRAQRLETARQLADEVLFERALEADRGHDVPVEQLQAIADAGFYGVSVEGDQAFVHELLEIFAGGCLTTAFVFAQHLGATHAACTSQGAVKAELGEALASGRARAGVAFAHLLRPGPALTTATPTDGGWLYNGVAPWITGWGHIDVVHAGARHGDDVVWALVDAVDSATLRGDLLDLAAVNASMTVVAHFENHFVPATRVTRVDDYEQWKADYRLGLRANGSLPLGVTARCLRLLGPSPLDDELHTTRARLDALEPVDVDNMSAARADAALLAVRAATALVAATGGRALTLGEHAQRLLREAMFLMVQGQTPAIKQHMLSELHAT